MSNLINPIVVRFNVVNQRKFFAKSLMIAFALFGTFLLSGGEAKAQSHQQVATQQYLNLARACLQQGNDYCALRALQNAVWLSPLLARDPGLVQLTRVLQSRINASGYSQSSSRNDPRGGCRLPGFSNPYLDR